MGLFWKENNIVFRSDIPCVIFAKIAQIRFSKKGGDASEGGLELTRKDDASDFSSDDRGESEIV